MQPIRISTIVFAIVFSCFFFSGRAVASEQCAPMAAADQLKTLSTVYYADTPPPPKPRFLERVFFGRKFGKLGDHEKVFLNTTFAVDPNAHNKALKIWATRDSDKDGILDYRITCNGKFLENDTDVDGDGILNSLDHKPYKKSTPAPDENGNGVPDHIDWTEKDAQSAKIQQALYADYGVILVERSDAFPFEFADILNDIIRVAFRRPIRTCPDSSPDGSGPCVKGLRSLLTIAVDKPTSREKDDSILAEVIGPTGSMLIYTRADGIPTLEAFGTLAHEMMHHYQFSLDQGCSFPWTKQCEDQDFMDMKRNNKYHSTNFLQMISGVTEWSIGDFDSLKLFERVLAHDCEALRETSHTTSIEQLEQWYSEHDSDTYWEKLQSVNIVGDYALTDPFEWQAEFLIAYLYTGMEDYARKVSAHSSQKQKDIETCFGNSVKETTNDVFYHQPARGASMTKWFEENFALQEPDWRYLHDKYLTRFYAQCTDGT